MLSSWLRQIGTPNEADLWYEIGSARFVYDQDWSDGVQWVVSMGELRVDVWVVSGTTGEI